MSLYARKVPLTVFILAGLLLAAGGLSAAETGAPSPGLPWPATDALGRAVPLIGEAGPSQPDRFVGIFYFLWHNEPGSRSPLLNGPFDIARILEKDPDAIQKPGSPLWGGIGVSHYWGEPLYGYYRSNDPWILRRHAQLLSDAGIDTLIFDTTNARSYPDVYLRLCEVFRQLRLEGERTPAIVFMVNTEAGKTARQIYEALYKPGLFRELWFRWEGKPLMICDPAEADQELKEFFTLRRAHWPFTLTNTPLAWHWEATYPQPYGYTDNPAKPEQVNVSVAQNLREKDGKVTNMSAGDARGRSFHGGRRDLSPGAVNFGFNFEEQWLRACELRPPFVMITGWNEWIAGRWGKPDGPLVFVDQFDQEHSRDIEPMRGGHGDNYYWQLVANVRRYKGAPALPVGSAPLTIKAGQWQQWAAIQPTFHDHLGETEPRSFDGVGGLSYTNTTGRNDLRVMKVARDNRHLYFYAQSRTNLSPATGPNWMWLLIDADQDQTTGWHGYDFALNRRRTGDFSTVEKWEKGDWRQVGKARLLVAGNQMQLDVPRQVFGLSRGTDARIDFKWADNLKNPDDLMDFYVSGDVAPEGRFNFRFTAP